MAKGLKDRFLEDLSSILSQNPIDKSELSYKLQEIAREKFVISIKTTAKVQPRYCDGNPCSYYYNQPLDLSYLYKPQNCQVHRYCSYCLRDHILMSLQKNPNTRVLCKKCEFQSNFNVLEENELYFFITPEEKKEIEANYEDNQRRRQCYSGFPECSYKGSTEYIDYMVKYECDDYLCYFCYAFHVASKILEKINEITQNTNDRFVIRPWKIGCPHNHPRSINNFDIDHALDAIRKAGFEEEIIDKIETNVNQFKSVFEGRQEAFIKCANCSKLQVYNSANPSPCKFTECGKCLFQKHDAHPGSSCDDLLQDTWTLSTNAIPNPSPDDYSESAKKFKHTAFILSGLSKAIRLKLTNLYEAENKFCEKNFLNLQMSIEANFLSVITPFMTKQEAENQIKNGLVKDQATQCYIFLKEINANPPAGQNCFIECEIIGEGQLENKVPAQSDLKAPFPKIFWFGDKYYVSDLKGILIKNIGQI
ncbi:unnamed protein product [Blepharisma stoltei]|uniref:Uncharacterized protein n=1 Tax=Blepharisma stoltei TaxID=1481888 RepID=A0AAU9IMZ4_9CILI|nr:unnamed protein product [Blepharisma stoltei]